jgi:hypothetical protein
MEALRGYSPEVYVLHMSQRQAHLKRRQEQLVLGFRKDRNPLIKEPAQNTA